MADILNKEIELYKKVKRKLNLNKVCELTNFKPHSKQTEIIEKSQKGDFNVMVCLLPRRFGKSTVMSEIAFAELLCPYASVLLITPTFQNAKAIFDMVEKLVGEQHLPLKTRDSKALTFTLENDAKFMVVSQKNYENALGHRFSLVIVDETGSIDNIQEIWQTYISPAQNDYGLRDDGFMWSKTYFIGTARTYETDFYKLYEKAKNENFGYYLVEANVYDNTLLAPEFIDKIKSSVDKRTWEQEYLCIWQTSGDGENVYYAFDELKHTIDHEEILKKIDPKNKFIVGLDWGHTDNTAFILGCIMPMTGEIYILEEYSANMLPLAQHTANFRQRELKYTQYQPIRYGDPSGSQVIAELAYQHNYFVLPAPVELEEAVRQINLMFTNGKLYVSKNCLQLIKELKTMQWKDRESKQIRRTKEGHYDLALGAFRYGVYGWLKENDLQIQVINF